MLFDDIEVLIVLSEAKSLSQAADKLFMSRQGLSQRITNLENRVGTTLYDRTSTGIRMTRAGELVTNFARNTANLERSLAAQLAAIDERFDATIEVGMSFNDGVALLPKLVGGFMEEVPDARVHLEAGYEPQLIEKLHKGELDFALLENQAEEPGLVNEVLGYTKLVFIAPNKAPYNSQTKPVSIDTLLAWPMILYEWNSGRHMVGNRHFRERYGLSLLDHNMIARFDTHEAMVEGAKAGIGWATIPECIYARYKNDPDITRFKVNTGPMWYPVSLAWSNERILNDSARLFIEYIKHNIPEGYFSMDVEAIINS
ncbi:MAG: LysR family transcriptional regulator [Eggerthellaceae bacterium]|nr:LysR family transcriptional regulator [Eggerthellaceae bacterium]